MPTPASQPDPAEQLAEQLRDLLTNVTSCLEAPEGESLVVCQKHLLRVIDLLQTTRRSDTPIPPSTSATMRHINALRRQAETLLNPDPSGTGTVPLAYRRDGSAELTNATLGDFELEL